ncbi:MAG: hypothetical protein ACKPKO_44615, partial [Candidatus Fonsibacter sp.]
QGIISTRLGQLATHLPAGVDKQIALLQPAEAVTIHSMLLFIQNSKKKQIPDQHQQDIKFMQKGGISQ